MTSSLASDATDGTRGQHDAHTPYLDDERESIAMGVERGGLGDDTADAEKEKEGGGDEACS